MSRVLIGNLPPGTTIRNIDDFCSPFGRLLYVDVNNQGSTSLACVEYDSVRNANNLVRARHGCNFNGYNVQLKVMGDSGANFDNNRDNNYYNNSNSGPGSSMGNNSNIDTSQACRIYERFINEGYNPQVAKKKTLEFVTNLPGGNGNNQGFNNSNSGYFGQSQDMNSNNFGNDFNGNQNWGNNSFPGNQQMFPNSNWGNFNNPSNRQMSSNWGGGARGGGGMPYPQQPSSARWNSGVNRFDSNPGRGGNVINPNMVPRGGKPGPSVDHESYLQSVTIRKKIEAKITKGISTPRDLRNLQFHTQIINDYERNERLQNKQPKKNVSKDEAQRFQRYKSALGIVQKYKKQNQSKLPLKDRNLFIESKAIVDEYEKSILLAGKAKGGVAGTGTGTGKIAAAYEKKKQQLLKESKKNYPYDFSLSGAAKKKMRSLVSAGIQANEAKLLALHSSLVIRELISMKNGLKKTTVANGSDKSKQLVRVGANTKPATAKAGGANAKPAGAKPKQPNAEQNNAGKLKDMTKKERDGMRSANRLVFRYESKNTDIESLTDRDIALLRMSLRRLQIYHEKFDTPVRKTKYDILLSEKYDKKEADQNKKTENASENDQKKASKQETAAEEGADVAAAADSEVAEDAEVEEEGGEGEEVDEPAEDETIEEEAQE